MKSSATIAAPAPSETGTVHRVLRILSCLAERKLWGLNELSREVSLPRVATQRLLGLCRQLSFVAQDEQTGQYMPGLEFYRLAARLSEQMPINQVAEPILQSLTARTNETALLALLARNELKMFFSLIVPPQQPMPRRVETNVLQSLAWGAAGRSLLAFLSTAEIDEVIRREETSPLEGWPLAADALHQSLKSIRADGYAVTFAHRAPDMYGIAMPFFDAGNQIRGNINLTIPHVRFAPDDLGELIALLRHSASELTRQLGWSRR